MSCDKDRRGKTFGFGISALRKYPELIPLVSVVSFAIGFATVFSFYSLRKKPDVQVVRGHGHKTVWENVKPTEKRKLRVVNPDVYKPIPQVESMKREIGSYKS